VGLPAALDEIKAIASSRGLMLVEDAACAMGAEYHGERIGRPHSAIACFSFHPRKVLTTGEGGMITTSDDELAARMRRLRQHGMSISDLARHDSKEVIAESYDEIGFNYRMTDMQAALGMVQLRRLDQMLQRRRQLALRYTERLNALPWIIPPRETAGLRHTYQSYMLLLRSDAPVNRDELMKKLLDRGISTRRGVMAIHREAPYRAHWDRLLPNTNLATDSGLILPLYQDMTDGEQDWVSESLEEIGYSR
jgi:dTDP-4-amino-4,6-dideoxygalactose transaminase